MREGTARAYPAGMPAIPTRRLFVYIGVGVIVLVVGTLGLVSVRGGSAGDGEGVVIQAAGAVVDGSADGVGGAAGGTSGGSLDRAQGFGLLGDGQAISALPSTTSTTQAPRIWVQVAGAVRRPGVYQVSAEARVFEAVLEAGGFAGDADQEGVALAARLSDGCRVYVPRMGESAPGEVQTPTESAAGISGGSSATEAPAGPVSLNSATLEQLDTLPGIGPSLAQQIITYRERSGPFTSVDQLTDVPGIGPAKLEQLRPLVGL